MEHLKPYDIFEYVSNVDNARYILTRLLNDVSKYDILYFGERWDHESHCYLGVMTTRPIDKRLIEKYKNHSDRNGLILSYSHEVTGQGHDYNFYTKNKYTKRYYPGINYLYHVTRASNSDNIEENGILRHKWEDSKDWEHMPPLSYPGAVFAATSKVAMWRPPVSDYDVWLIDGSYPDIKWQTDLNFLVNQNTPHYVMTYQDIPPDRVELWNGNWRSVFRLYMKDVTKDESSDGKEIIFTKRGKTVMSYDKGTKVLTLSDDIFWDYVHSQYRLYDQQEDGVLEYLTTKLQIEISEIDNF